MLFWQKKITTYQPNNNYAIFVKSKQQKTENTVKFTLNMNCTF